MIRSRPQQAGSCRRERNPQLADVTGFELGLRRRPLSPGASQKGMGPTGCLPPSPPSAHPPTWTTAALPNTSPKPRPLAQHGARHPRQPRCVPPPASPSPHPSRVPADGYLSCPADGLASADANGSPSLSLSPGSLRLTDFLPLCLVRCRNHRPAEYVPALPSSYPTQGWLDR